MEETDYQPTEKNDLKVKATTGQKLDENMPLVENYSPCRYTILIQRVEGTYLNLGRKLIIFPFVLSDKATFMLIYYNFANYPLPIEKSDRHQDLGAVDSTVKCVRQGPTVICQLGPGPSPVTAEVIDILESEKGPAKRLQTGVFCSPSRCHYLAPG